MVCFPSHVRRGTERKRKMSTLYDECSGDIVLNVHFVSTKWFLSEIFFKRARAYTNLLINDYVFHID